MIPWQHIAFLAASFALGWTAYAFCDWRWFRDAREQRAEKHAEYLEAQTP